MPAPGPPGPAGGAPGAASLSAGAADLLARLQFDRPTQARAFVAGTVGFACFVLFCVEASRSTASGAQGHLVKAWDGRRERKFLEDYPMPVVTLCPAQPAAVLSGVKCEWLTEGEDERSASVIEYSQAPLQIKDSHGVAQAYSCISANPNVKYRATTVNDVISCTVGFEQIPGRLPAAEVLVSTWYPPEKGKDFLFKDQERPSESIQGWITADACTSQDILLNGELFKWGGKDHFFLKPTRGVHTHYRTCPPPSTYVAGQPVVTVSVSHFPGYFSYWQSETLYSRNQMFGVVGGFIFLMTWFYALAVWVIFSFAGWKRDSPAGQAYLDNRDLLAGGSSAEKYQTPASGTGVYGASLRSQPSGLDSGAGRAPEPYAAVPPSGTPTSRPAPPPPPGPTSGGSSYGGYGAIN